MAMHRHTDDTKPADVLRARGFRVTRGRIQLLDILRKASRPLSIREVRTGWRTSPDQATLYRTLTDLAKAGVVQRLDLNTGVAHFEYAPDKPHHHHIVCVGCGKVEDIDHCREYATPSTKAFKKIYSHTLEFFGLCRTCAK